MKTDKVCSSELKDNGRLMTPLMDWSFKFIFGTEQSKPNLLGFLNMVLMPESPIVNVHFLNNEVIPVSPKLKGTVFDLICEDGNKDKYLIEVQNQRADNILDRIIFYTCRLIERMGQKGDQWDYSDIKKVYSICIMNFTFGDKAKLRRDVQLYYTDDKEQYSDKLNIILLQLPYAKSFNMNECKFYYEYLLSLLKEMDKEMKTKDQLKQEVAQTQLSDEIKEYFYSIIDTAHIGSLSEKERLQYEANLKSYRHTMSCIRYAENKGRAEGRAEGRVEGRAEGRVEVAKALKAKGVDVAIICETTKLSADEVDKL